MDLSGVDGDGTIVWHDADTILSRCMPRGHIDPEAFRTVVGGIVRETSRSGREVRAYGEMVALLWDAGDVLDEVCHLHTSVIDEATARFVAGANAPLAARRFVSSVLARRPYHGRVNAGAAKLVVSEPAANAVVHAGTPFSVSVRPHGSAVRISVRDWSPTRPLERNVRPTDLCGRGLHLVAAMADRWGVDPDPDGNTVWADLPLR